MSDILITATTEDDEAWLYGEPKADQNLEKNVSNISQESIELHNIEETHSLKAPKNEDDLSKIMNGQPIAQTLSEGLNTPINENQINNNHVVEDDDDDDDDDVQVTIRDIKANPTQYNYGPKPSLPFNKPLSQIPAVKFNKLGTLDIEEVVKYNNIPLFDVNLEELADKPWRKPGADITDYFNYGFNEDTWLIYCERQRTLRADNEAFGKIRHLVIPQPFFLHHMPPHLGTQLPPFFHPPPAFVPQIAQPALKPETPQRDNEQQSLEHAIGVTENVTENDNSAILSSTKLEEDVSMEQTSAENASANEPRENEPTVTGSGSPTHPSVQLTTKPAKVPLLAGVPTLDHTSPAASHLLLAGPPLYQTSTAPPLTGTFDPSVPPPSLPLGAPIHIPPPGFPLLPTPDGRFTLPPNLMGAPPPQYLGIPPPHLAGLPPPIWPPPVGNPPTSASHDKPADGTGPGGRRSRTPEPYHAGPPSYYKRDYNNGPGHYPPPYYKRPPYGSSKYYPPPHEGEGNREPGAGPPDDYRRYGRPRGYIRGGGYPGGGERRPYYPSYYDNEPYGGRPRYHRGSSRDRYAPRPEGEGPLEGGTVEPPPEGAEPNTAGALPATGDGNQPETGPREINEKAPTGEDAERKRGPNEYYSSRYAREGAGHYYREESRPDSRRRYRSPDPSSSGRYREKRGGDYISSSRKARESRDGSRRKRSSRSRSSRRHHGKRKSSPRRKDKKHHKKSKRRSDQEDDGHDEEDRYFTSPENEAAETAVSLPGQPPPEGSTTQPADQTTAGGALSDEENEDAASGTTSSEDAASTASRHRKTASSSHRKKSTTATAKKSHKTRKNTADKKKHRHRSGKKSKDDHEKGDKSGSGRRRRRDEYSKSRSRSSSRYNSKRVQKHSFDDDYDKISSAPVVDKSELIRKIAQSKDQTASTPSNN